MGIFFCVSKRQEDASLKQPDDDDGDDDAMQIEAISSSRSSRANDQQHETNHDSPFAILP